MSHSSPAPPDIELLGRDLTRARDDAAAHANRGDGAAWVNMRNNLDRALSRLARIKRMSGQVINMGARNMGARTW